MSNRSDDNENDTDSHFGNYKDTFMRPMLHLHIAFVHSTGHTTPYHLMPLPQGPEWHEKITLSIGLQKYLPTCKLYKLYCACSETGFVFTLVCTHDNIVFAY